VRKTYLLMLIVGVILVARVSPSGAETWIAAADGTPPGPMSIDVVSATLDEVVLDVELAGFYVEEVQTDLGPFLRIRVPGAGRTVDIGKALLPILGRGVEIPQGSTPEVEILGRTTARMDLAAMGLPVRVFPVQEPVEKLPGARESARFVMSDAFYAASALYPAETVRIAEVGQLRGHRYAMLKVSPVRYEPALGTLEVTQRLRVRVTNPGADPAQTRATIDRYASPGFEAIASNALLNYQPPQTKTVLPLPIGYLIITDADFYSELLPLADWKNSKGYETTVTQTADVPGGATTTAIQNYIKDAWLNWPTPPSFVLLVGDVADIPNWVGSGSNNPATDLYYATMTDGDYIPDLGVGRFSVTSPTQAAALVEKTVDYERVLLASGTAWLKKAVFMASEDNYTVTEGTHNYVISTYLDPAGYTCDKLYCHTYSATTQQVRDAFNDGRELGIYSGHGATDYWADGPYFSQSDVNGLTNYDMYPFVQSYACYTGQYTLGECFAETWIRGVNNAGLAFWGSSVTSYWDEDDILEKGVFEAMFADGFTWVSGMLDQGKWYLYEHYSGGGSTQRYYEMYNLMGDPSLDIWTAHPAVMNVTHAGTCPVGAEAYSVHVAEAKGPLADALVCLNMPGVVYETAYTDASGDAEVVLDPPPTEVGEMTLTVTRHNGLPFIDVIDVIVPAIVTLDPDTIQVEVATPVTVTVLDTLSAPMPNVVVTIDGWGLDPALVDTTDASGQAVITVDAPYGETLTVVGREIGQTYDCFELPLVVAGALALPSPRLEARVDEVGLLGALTPYYVGALKGQVAHAGLDLFAVGCGVDTMTSSAADTAVLEVTPVALGTIDVAMAYSGYEVYVEQIPVIEVYGLLTGTVSDGATTDPLVGVPVSVYTAGADTSTATPVFEVASGAGGSYASPDSIPAGMYDVYAKFFGYLDHFGTTMVYWGGNTYDIAMTPAPSGTVAGTVTEENTGHPITASIKIYRSDDGSLYSETTSDSLSGGQYETGSLPYFTYLFRVRAPHYMTQNVYVAVDEATETVDFEMVPTQGNLLVVDDNTGDKATGPKVGDKGEILPFDGDPGSGQTAKSAAALAQDLEDLGYDVTTETSAATDPVTWPNYDIVIWSCGDDTNPVSEETYRTSLNGYVEGHGKLIIEGGEVGYDACSYPGYPDFAATTLHCVDWEHDSSGNLSLAAPTHPIATTPNALPTTLVMTYVGYGDQDALIPDAETEIVYEWSSYAGQGGVLVYDDNPDPGSSQVVFYSFNYSAVTDTVGREELLENTIAHLLAPESTPEGIIRGQVALYEEPTFEGVVVRTHPMGVSDTTDAAGNYELVGLYDGTYQVTASKVGFSDSTAVVEIVAGGTVEGIDFTLYPIDEYMANPEMPIPDNNPTGIRVQIDVPDDLLPTAVDCYVNITHSYQGDLIVELTSPKGTIVRLHNQTGGSVDDIITWYDSETEPDGPGTMDDFCGDSALGTWELFVSDNASYDTGILHSWGLRFETPPVTAVDDELVSGKPSVHFLARNYPNPFNPLTHLQFGLPKASDVEVAVYNVRGQRVRVLTSQHYEPGIYGITWDGTDTDGRTVASGVYFCRMTAGDFTACERMVLMK